MQRFCRIYEKGSNIRLLANTRKRNLGHSSAKHCGKWMNKHKINGTKKNETGSLYLSTRTHAMHKGYVCSFMNTIGNQCFAHVELMYWNVIESVYVFRLLFSVIEPGNATRCLFSPLFDVLIFFHLIVNAHNLQKCKQRKLLNVFFLRSTE